MKASGGSSFVLPSVPTNNGLGSSGGIGAMKSRGGQGSSGKPALGSSGRKSRGPGVGSLQNRLPPPGSINANSGAGFKSNSGGSLGGSPYGGSSLSKAGAGSLNTNVFNIPKYGGLGGGIGGGIGGGGIGGGLGRAGAGIAGGPLGSAGAANK